MTRKKFVRRAAIPAAALVIGLAVTGFVLVSGAPATVQQNLGDEVPRRLQMFIQNGILSTVLPVGGASLHEDPYSIAPGATGEVKANANSDVNGHVTYADNFDASAATCSVTLHFEYSYNVNKYICKDQTFTLTTNTGTCKLQQTGACGGAGNCECNFTLTPQ